MLDQFSVPISSTIKRRSVAGFWISCRAFLKIAPSIPDCGPLGRGPFIENLAIVSFEFFAVAPQQAGPIESFRHDHYVVRRLRLLVGHFQKEQKRDLLGVSHVGKPIIPQDMGKVYVCSRFKSYA